MSKLESARETSRDVIGHVVIRSADPKYPTLEPNRSNDLLRSQWHLTTTNLGSHMTLATPPFRKTFKGSYTDCPVSMGVKI